MSQTVVKEQGLALNGQIYDLSVSVKSSKAAEGRVLFGRFVSRGTDAELQCLHPATAANITSLKEKLGVALQSHANENLQDGLAPGYEDKKPVSIMEKGKVYVEVEAAVTPASDVYVRHAVDGGLDQLGIFAPAAGTGLAQLANARWESSSVDVDGKLIAVLNLL